MTLPIGTAIVTVRADSDKVEGDIERGVRKGADAAEDDLKDAGKKMGDTLGDSMGDELEKHGPDLAKSVEKGLSRQKIKTKTTVEFDREGTEVRRWVSTVTQDIRDAFKDEGRPGGPLTQIGRTASDAIGAGFNVSGRSPLIALLIPVIGEIGLLIGGLIEAVGALVAYLYLIPSAIGAIVLQAGVLFLAFQGVGTAIQGAFAATNAEELKEAIKGLTAEGQVFVRSLLPLKDLFTFFRDIIQVQFFTGFQGGIDSLISALSRGRLAEELGTIAFALGTLFKTFLGFLDSGSFQRFLHELIPATVRWINDFGPALLRFLAGLATLGHVVMPFFEAFGKDFNEAIGKFGDWLAGLAYDPEFIKFLEDARETMAVFGQALLGALDFLLRFWQVLKEAGGDKFLADLIEQLDMLGDFFEHGAFGDPEFGKKALEGLIHAIQALAFVFLALVAGVLGALAVLEYLFEWLKHTLLPLIGQGLVNAFVGLGYAAKAVIDFLYWLVVEAIPSAAMAVTNFLGTVIAAIGRFIGWLVGAIIGAVAAVVFWVIDAWNDITGFISRIPGIILGAIGDLGNLLWQSGRSLIQGFLNGVESMIQPIRNVMSNVMSVIRRYTPLSPAKEGPLSGKGDPLHSGQEIIRRLAMGIQMEGPTLQAATASATGNIFFGPGSVRVGFEGAVPTAEQAQTTGAAAGRGIVNALATRNTRLQIRTM